MFEGIVEGTGEVMEINHNGDTEFSMRAHFIIDDLVIGDSISCSGVCVTIASIKDNIFKFQASEATLSVTNMQELKVSSTVNLERCIKYNARISGHIVQGHVDGVCRVKNITQIKDSHVWVFSANQDIMKYIIKKGSIAINGVSLTVNSIINNTFNVNMIPHTYSMTNFRCLNIGDLCNVECDILNRCIIDRLDFS